MSVDKGPAPFGVGTVVIRNEVNECVGVGYVTQEPGSRLAQQRWVLYPGYEGPPAQVVTFAPAERQYGSLEEWFEDLRKGSLWKAGSRYVKADVSTLEQIFFKGVVVIQQQEKLVGYVETTFPDTVQQIDRSGELHTSERWVLFDGYAPLSDAPITLRGLDSSQDPSPEKLRALGGSEGLDLALVKCSTFDRIPDVP